MRDAGRKHAVLAEAGVDHPWIVRDTVAPVVCMIIMALLAAAGFVVRVGVADCERFAMWRVFVVIRARVTFRRVR